MRVPVLVAALALFAASCFAQTTGPNGKNIPFATVIRPTTVYLQGDTGSDKLGEVATGREMVILLRSGPWFRVQANTDQETIHTQDQPVFTNQQPEQPLSGWVQATNVVSSDTPNGQAVLFGLAIAAENAASDAHPEPGAALDARRLYRMAAELFPQDSRTAESLWRSADIRWQLQKDDAASRPSAHEKESYLRQQPDESEMRKIQKQFPGTKWASYAAFEMIDNNLCGDWQGSELCPEKEASAYTSFADKFPDSPRAAQALYQAAWRLACAGDMWTEDGKDDRAKSDRNTSVTIAQHLLTKYAESDYAARAAGLVYKVEHAIPVYGSARQ